MSKTARGLTVTPQTLAGVDIFADLDGAEKDAVLTYCQGRVYASGETIVATFDSSNDVYVVIGGQVRVALYSQTGREVIFRDLGSGSIFGELSAIDGEQRSAYVRALDETTVIRIGSEQFMLILEQFPSATRRLLRHLTGLVRSLSERVFEHDSLNVNSRILPSCCVLPART